MELPAEWIALMKASFADDETDGVDLAGMRLKGLRKVLKGLADPGEAASRISRRSRPSSGFGIQ